MLLLAGLTSLLGACGTMTPSVQVTGQWQGSLILGENLPALMPLKLDLTQTTMGGDFTGTLTSSEGQTSSVGGNTISGTLSGKVNDQALNCKGTFNGAQYVGTCTLGQATMKLNIVKTS